MGYNSLLKKIKDKTAKIGIIGLGYVGLPLALLFAKRGFFVTGFVRSVKKKELLKSGKNHLLDYYLDQDLKEALKKGKFKVQITNPKDLAQQEVLIICVPTPITKDNKPDLSDLEKVAQELGKIDVSQKLIINESTVAPFTTRELFGDLRGTYFLACSPERIDPGNKKKTTQNIPKVIGARDRESLELAVNLYNHILSHGSIAVSSLESAEMVKMLENTYRAVNIALVNEFAKLTDRMGIDILEVIHAAESKWSFHPHHPGIGVGGHCIPVDPYYILKLANDYSLPMRVVEEGLLVNEHMPFFVAEKIMKYYKKGLKVLIYGLSYKRDVNDMRESPVIVLCKFLKERNVDFYVYDPLLSKDEIRALGFRPGILFKVDVFVVGTDHSSLLKDYKKVVGRETLVVDGRNYFLKKVGKGVLGVGRNLV